MDCTVLVDSESVHHQQEDTQMKLDHTRHFSCMSNVLRRKGKKLAGEMAGKGVGREGEGGQMGRVEGTLPVKSRSKKVWNGLC